MVTTSGAVAAISEANDFRELNSFNLSFQLTGATMTTLQKTAVVTGSARGIGAAVAKRLSNDGFSVAILDLDETACKVVVDEIKSAGGEALPVAVDVSDEQSV